MATPARPIQWDEFNKIKALYARGLPRYTQVPGRLGDITIHTGHVYMSPSGPRLVLIPGGQGGWVYYLDMTKAQPFVQAADDFVADVGMDMVEAYRRGVVDATGSVVLAWFLIKVMVTILSAGNASIFAVSTLVEIGSSLSEEQKEGFPTWAKITAVVALRKFLKAHAPKLWDIMFWKFLKDAAWNTLDPDSYSLEDFILLLAAITGKLGGFAKLASKLTIIKTAASILITVLAKVVPAGFKGAAVDYKKSAESLVHELQRLGFNISKEDIPVLTRELAEIRRHEAELREVYQKLASAFQK